MLDLNLSFKGYIFKEGIVKKIYEKGEFKMDANH